METDGTHDGQTAEVGSAQPVSPRPSREQLIQFLDNLTDSIQNISNSLQCIKDAIQRGQCRREVIEDSIDEAQEDIENIMNSLQDGPYGHQIVLCHREGVRTILSNLLSMKDTLKEIQDDIQEIEEASGNAENEAFGEDWFRWEDWRVDKTFMEEFYESLNKMMKDPREVRRRESNGFGVNPLVEMLLRRKGDKEYEKLDIDKMIRFLNGVGVKYWYAVVNSKYDPDEAINSLKGNPNIAFTDFIKFVKRNPAREN